MSLGPKWSKSGLTNSVSELIIARWDVIAFGRDVAEGELSAGRALGAFARQLHRERRLRDASFPPGLFGEGIWDILLDLFASEADDRKVRVSSACIAACVPASTALRYLSEMERLGMIVRSPSPDDRRGQYVALSEDCRAEMRELLGRLQSARLNPPSPDRDG